MMNMTLHDLAVLLNSLNVTASNAKASANADDSAPEPAKGDALAAHPYKVGDAVFIRTVTYHYIGKIVGVYANEITLIDATWVADSGRWSAALKTGTLSEVEPFPDGDVVVISRGTIVDVSPWRHALPRSVK